MSLPYAIWQGNLFDDFFDDFSYLRYPYFYLFDHSPFDDLFHNNGNLFCCDLLNYLNLWLFDVSDDFLLNYLSIAHLVRVGLIDELSEEGSKLFLIEGRLEYGVFNVMIFQLW